MEVKKMDEKKLRCTYFPMEAKYLAFLDLEIIGKFEETHEICLQKARNILETK